MTISDVGRLHPVQERHRVLAGDSPARRLALRLRLPAGIDLTRLETALDRLAEGSPEMFGAEVFGAGPGGPSRLTVRRLGAADAATAEAHLNAFENDGVVPGAVLVDAPDGPRLGLVLDRMLVEHAAAGWLVTRLAEIYEGGAAGGLAGPPRHQGAVLSDDVLAELRAEFSEIPLDVLLPRRPRLDPGPRHGVHRFRIPPVTPDTLVAAYAVLLHRYSRQPAIFLGVERDRPDPDARRGAVADLIPLAAAFTAGTTFADVTASVAAGVARGLARPPVPTTILAELLGRPMTPDAPYLYTTVVAFRDRLPQVLTAEGRWSCAESPYPPAGADLELVVSDGDDRPGRDAEFRFRADVLDPALVPSLARHLQRLLESAVAEPAVPVHRLTMLGGDDLEALLRVFNNEEDPWVARQPLFRTVEQHARRIGDVPALAAGTEQITYRQLNERANRVAHHLLARGVRHGDVVGVVLERGPEWLEVFLAAGKIGAIVLPFDPRVPALRLNATLEAVPAVVTVTVARLGGELRGPVLRLDDDRALIEAEPGTDPRRPVQLDDLAYVMQTSGSTGTPKAVFGQQRVLAHIGASFAGVTRLGVGDRASWMTPTGFGTTLAEVAQALSAGATLVATPGPVIASPPALQEWLVENRINVCFTVTQIGDALQHRQWDEDCPLRVLIMGGEKLHHWGPADVPFDVAVGYGCHEALFVANPLYPWEERLTSARATADDRISPPPIGRPNPGVRLYILGDEGELMPTGAVGEIWFDSPEGALGYWKDPAQTADKFRPDPYGPPGSRIYRTGDLGGYRGDGLLEHHGRIDDMVKVRGCRVELGEVEASLAGHPDVAEAAVVAVRDALGEAQLVACVALHHDQSPAALHDYLSERLPDYMVPTAFVPMPELPRNINGKVDRPALPPRDWASRRVRAPYREPANELERSIAELWAEVLDEPRFGVDDSFLDLGGTSLHAGRLLTRLRERTRLPASLQDVFFFPTPAGLARLLQTRDERPAEPALPPITARRSR